MVWQLEATVVWPRGVVSDPAVWRDAIVWCGNVKRLEV